MQSAHFSNTPDSAGHFSSPSSDSQRPRTCSSSFGRARTKPQLCSPLTAVLLPPHHPAPRPVPHAKWKAEQVGWEPKSPETQETELTLTGEGQEGITEVAFILELDGLDGKGTAGRRWHALMAQSFAGGSLW